MRCLNCQYDLQQLAEHRCPECGRVFDPEDRRTYMIPGRLDHLPRISIWEFFGGVLASLILMVALLVLFSALLIAQIRTAAIPIGIVLFCLSGWYLLYITTHRRPQ